MSFRDEFGMLLEQQNLLQDSLRPDRIAEGGVDRQAMDNVAGADPVRKALVELLVYILSGDHYQQRNPYSVKQVEDGLVALGLNKYGEVSEAIVEEAEGREVVIRVWRGLASVVKKPKGMEVAILDYDVQDEEGEAELKQAQKVARTCDVVVKVKGGVADVEKKPKGVDVKIVDKD